MAEKQYDPTSKKVFVFGSNLAGLHLGGAAKYAYDELGAMWGLGEGISMGKTGHMSYALPTVRTDGSPMSLDEIKLRVQHFLTAAKYRDDLKFFVTRIGCGIAGYTDEQIAPMFQNAPRNCELPEAWLALCNTSK